MSSASNTQQTFTVEVTHSDIIVEIESHGFGI